MADQVAIPTNADEAALMVLTGVAWLKQHAPERLTGDEYKKDAERWRHCKAHGHPMTGPQCIAWTFDGRMVFGATLEEAVDNAMACRVPAVGAA